MKRYRGDVRDVDDVCDVDEVDVDDVGEVGDVKHVGNVSCYIRIATQWHLRGKCYMGVCIHGL